MVDTDGILGRKMKQRPAVLNLTQDELSRKADVPYTTLVKIETGVVKSPSVQTVQMIAQALEVTIDELIS